MPACLLSLPTYPSRPIPPDLPAILPDLSTYRPHARPRTYLNARPTNLNARPRTYSPRLVLSDLGRPEDSY